jgi:hypothetical protein
MSCVSIGPELPEKLAEAVAAGKPVSARRINECAYLFAVEETGLRWELHLTPLSNPVVLNDEILATHEASAMRESRPLEVSRHTETYRVDDDLERRIVQLLAPGALSFDSIVKAVSGGAVGRKEVAEALRRVTTARGAVYDLNRAGYAMIDMKGIEKHQRAAVAERAASSLIGTADISRFVQFLSKDVIFSLGGLFEGEIADEESADEGKSPNALSSPTAKPAARISSMKQIWDINWDEAILPRAETFLQSEKLLASLEAARASHFNEPAVPESPISDDATLSKALANFNTLASSIKLLEECLLKFEAACSKARAWISEKSSSHDSNVVREINDWAAAQQPAAASNTRLLRRMRAEASLLRREIDDYIIFRDEFPKPSA